MACRLPFCNICDKFFNTLEQQSDHEKGQSHLDKLRTLEGQTRIKMDNDSNKSSFGLKTCDYPDDTPGVETVPVQPVEPDSPIPTNPRPNQEMEGNGKEYYFDEKTKTGRCYICRVTLSSRQQKDDHITCKGHEKKRKNLGLVNTNTTMFPMGAHGSVGEIVDHVPIPQNVCSIGNRDVSASNLADVMHNAKMISDAKQDDGMVLPSGLNNLSKSENKIGTAAGKREVVREAQSVHNCDSSQENQYVEGNGKEYDFDETTKTGRCYICKVNLSSRQQKDDHIVSKGHQRKRKNLGLVTPNVTPMGAQNILGDVDVQSSSPQNIADSEDLHVSDSNSSYGVSCTNINLSSSVTPSTQSQRQDDNVLTSGLNHHSQPEPTSKTTGRELNSGADTVQSLDSSQQNQYVEGTGIDYDFDKETKTGKCYICNVNLSSCQQKDDHISSKGHQKKRKSLENASATPDLTPTAIQGAAVCVPGVPHDIGRNAPNIQQHCATDPCNTDSDILVCELCNARFSGVIDQKKHLEGAKHKKEMLKRDIKAELSGRPVDGNESEETKKKEVFDSSERRNLNIEPKQPSSPASSTLSSIVENDQQPSSFPTANAMHLPNYGFDLGQSSDGSILHGASNTTPKSPASAPTQGSANQNINNEPPVSPWNMKGGDTQNICNNASPNVSPQSARGQDIPNIRHNHAENAPSQNVRGGDNQNIRNDSAHNCPLQNASRIEYNLICDVCNVVLTSQVVARQHYEGQQHRKKSERPDSRSVQPQGERNINVSVDVNVQL